MDNPKNTICMNCVLSNSCEFHYDDDIIVTLLHHESKKQDSKLVNKFANFDRFSKFFYCYTHWEICNKKIITDPATP